MSKVAGGDFCSVVSTVPKCKRGPTHKRWIFTATQLWIAEINYLHITSEGPFAHLIKFYLVKQGMDRHIEQGSQAACPLVVVGNLYRAQTSVDT